MSNKRAIQFVVSILFSAAALYYFFMVTPEPVFRVFVNHVNIALISFAILLPVYALRAAKFFLLVRNFNPDFRRLSGSLFAGIALNNVIPFRFGDVVRVVYLNKAVEMKLPLAIMAIILERLVDLFTIAVLFSLFLATFFWSELVHLLAQYLRVLITFVAFIIVASLFLFCRRRAMARRAQMIMDRFSLSWWLLPRDFFVVLMTSFAQWALETLFLGSVLSFLVFNSSGIEFESSAPLGLLSVFLCNLSTMVPSAPGYVGTFEAAGIFPFDFFEFQHMTLAAVFVMVLHGSIWLFSSLLGLVSIVAMPQLHIFRSGRQDRY